MFIIAGFYVTGSLGQIKLSNLSLRRSTAPPWPVDSVVAIFDRPTLDGLNLYQRGAVLYVLISTSSRRYSNIQVRFCLLSDFDFVGHL